MSTNIPNAFVWTKMQSDGGETLPAIRNRKELERQTGNGTFWWGVGESKGRAIAQLAQRQTKPCVLFSQMLTRPHAQSSTPDCVFLWQNYLGPDGEVPLPANVIVTSGPDRNGLPKRHYYALICKSCSSILNNGGGTLDAASLRNLGGSRVGSSQVTSVVERVKASDPSIPYPITARATLVPPYAVTLCFPRELTQRERELLNQVKSAGKSPQEWLAVAKQLRGTEMSQVL